jgi:hypothetical protein
VTSVHAALLCASKSTPSFFFFLLRRPLLPLVERPLQPRRFASATFLAAERSARLCFLLRLGMRREKPVEVDPGAGGGGAWRKWCGWWGWLLSGVGRELE